MNKTRLQRGLLLAPAIFLLHFLEESQGFVTWFNNHVGRGITSSLFWSVNISAMLVTLLVISLEWFLSSAESAFIVLIWLSFLMMANAIFHITGAIVDQGYVPGLITAIVLYVPYFSWLSLEMIKGKRLSKGAFVLFVVIGSLPMLVHGYRILFLGTRLF